MRTEITILIYFIFIVGIGVYSAFRIKKPSDYYVAGKKAKLLPVSGSLLATILGGSALMGTIELSQTRGWAALWFLFSAAIGLFILAPISKYVSRYGNYTLPELLGKFFGRKAERFSTIIIPLAWLGIVAAQIIAAAQILQGLGFISYQNAAILSGFVFIVYTLLGGQLSILKTDTLQAVLIVGGLAALLFYGFKSPEHKQVEPLNINALFNASFSLVDLIVLLMTYSVTFIVGPDIYSRLFCASNEKTARKSILIVATLLIPISFALTYLGVYSGGNNEGIMAFAGHLLPNWAYGLFIAALLSAVMSSADTTLLTSSMILSELFSGNLEKKQSLPLTRWLVIVIGILSLLIALYITSVIQALLLALSFFSGAFVVPVLFGLLAVKVNKKNVIWAMFLGGITALTGKLFTLFNYQDFGNGLIILSYFVNTFFLLIGRRSNSKNPKATSLKV
ncbi:sodium:solute symporter family protein [Draconibacterium halophilum]|uniref:Sodium:solute symporter family protein n=1 Tax=Draconibacterium halophilum TaxID=2706887 RepID=A0A6C0RCQ0_9BACT|nr:sodium:solute symporter family protein [Draconibacterium halophilum]QIA08428.1 sodium:solute symporter family protein [Draconibacterium halophilum]